MKGIMKKIRKQQLLIAAALLAVLFILSGCGTGSSKSAGSEMAVAETAAAAADSFRPVSAPAAMPGAGLNENKAEMEEAGTPAAPSDPGSSQAALPTGRKLIRTVHMSLQTEDFDGLWTAVSEQITALGGYMEQSSMAGKQTDYNGNPIPRSAAITARIPSQKLDQFISGVSSVGNVTGKSESVEDVTLQYSDVESRKKSLEIEQERIWALLEKADTLEAIIALEERLSEIRYELESMESRLRVFDNQVEYSTVYLNLDEILDRRLTPDKPLGTGERIARNFSDNLKAMGAFLVDLFVTVISLAPFWLPLLLVIWAVFWFTAGRKLAKKRKAAQEAKKAAQEAEKTAERSKNQQG